MNYAAAVLGATDPLLPGRRGPQARIVTIDPLCKPRFYQLLRYSFVLVLAYCRGLYEDASRDIFPVVCLPHNTTRLKRFSAFSERPFGTIRTTSLIYEPPPTV